MIHHLKTLGGMLCVAALLAACADRVPTAATGRPSLDHELLLAEPLGVQVATRVAPIGDGVQASAVIGPRGGVLLLPEAGLLIVVPRGAVQTNTLFSARALPGSAIAYEFEPHGATFAQPIRVQQLFGGAHGVDVSGGVPNFEGAYFADGTQLDVAASSAQVKELLPATVDPAGRLVFFYVHHFSGYLLASGRSGGGVQ